MCKGQRNGKTFALHAVSLGSISGTVDEDPQAQVEMIPLHRVRYKL